MAAKHHADVFEAPTPATPRQPPPPPAHTLLGALASLCRDTGAESHTAQLTERRLLTPLPSHTSMHATAATPRVQVSSKAGTGIGEIFEAVVQHFHSRGASGGAGHGGLSVSGVQAREGGGCC